MALKRQQIVDAIKTRLQGILIANGYATNLGNNIFEWRVTNLNSAEFPACVYRDVSNAKQDGAIGSFRWALNIEIQLVTDGETSAAEIRKLIADVYKAIGTDVRWGGLAVTTEQPESDEMDVEQHEKKQAGALIKLSIIYDANMWEM